MKPQYIEIDTYGNTYYYSDKAMTVLHREDGPAIEYPDGTKEWYIDGKLHREDGPAAEWADGTKEWWINSKYLTEQEFLQATAPTVELTLDEIAAKFGVSVEKLKIKK